MRALWAVMILTPIRLGGSETQPRHHTRCCEPRCVTGMGLVMGRGSYRRSRDEGRAGEVGIGGAEIKVGLGN